MLTMHTPSYAPHRRRSSRGFTLIEVMISLLVFSFGVLGAAAMQAIAVQNGTQNGDRSRAAMLANEMVSNLWGKQSATPVAGDLTAWQGRVSNAAATGLPNGSGTVTSCGTNCATVNVYWKAPSAKAAAASSAYSTNVVIQ
jgi:type IV pilus assembly protein PilV